MTEPEASGPDAVESALLHLRALGKQSVVPNRRDARALLLPLGELLLADGASAHDGVLERARAVVATLGEGWTQAALDELSLAATEHIQSADPRYLGLPNYDFTYTFRARERLEARIAAAGELDLALPKGLQNGVREADERLRPHLGQGPRD